ALDLPGQPAARRSRARARTAAAPRRPAGADPASRPRRRGAARRLHRLALTRTREGARLGLRLLAVRRVARGSRRPDRRVPPALEPSPEPGGRGLPPASAALSPRQRRDARLQRRLLGHAAREHPLDADGLALGPD